jgi:membrane protein YdbS with pleckstrin-like domain
MARTHRSARSERPDGVLDRAASNHDIDTRLSPTLFGVPPGAGSHHVVTRGRRDVASWSESREYLPAKSLMSYVDKNLIPGETVVYRGSLTRLSYGWVLVPAALAIAAAVFRSDLPAGHRWLPAMLLVAVSVFVWLRARIRFAAAEFAVTSRRVIITLGILQRRTVETMLTKVEAITVEQTLNGRLFNYGTITVTGTGGTRETFENLAAPLEFRRQVQGQMARIDDDRGLATRAAQAGLR